MEIYKSFLNSKKKKLVSMAMALVTVASVVTLSSCTTKKQDDTGVSLSEEYLESIRNALNNEDTVYSYNSDQDIYLIDSNVYMYDISDPNYKKCIRTETLTMSGTIARAYGYSSIFDSKINNKKLGK